MGVLAAIGQGLLWLLAGVGALLALVLLLLCLPVFFSFTYDGEQPRARIRVCGIPKTLLPARDKPEKKKKKKATEKPEEPKESRLARLTKEWKQDGLGSLLSAYTELARLAVGTLGKLLRVPILRRVQVHVTVAKEDPDQTALLYGKVCGVLYPARTVLQYAMRIRRAQVAVQPDFLAEQSRATAQVYGHFYPYRLLGVLLSLAIGYLKWSTIRPKKQEVIQDGKQGQ